MRITGRTSTPEPAPNGVVVRVASKDELAPLADYVDKETTSAWLRKASFETRAFSLVTLNIGAVTLYFALVSNFGMQLSAADKPSKTFLIFIILSSAISIASAAFSAFPANYSAFGAKDLDDLLTEALSGQSVDHFQQLLEVRISQLASAYISNQRKAIAIFLSFGFFGLSSVLLIASLLVALLPS